METLDLKIVAAAVGLLDGFQPEYWTVLPDTRGRRVLITDPERSVIAALLTEEQSAKEEAEQLGAAALRNLLPRSEAAFPRLIARGTVPADQFGASGLHLHILAPLPGLPASNIMFSESAEAVESLARLIAALHDADPGVLADSGLEVEDTAESRVQLLADLDRGAETGRVPAALLGRWEAALENVGTWRWLPSPVHGALTEDALRVDDGQIAALSDLGRLHVGDPAEDLAALSAFLDPPALESFFRTYLEQRSATDPGLRTRIEILSELTALDWLLEAVDSGSSADIADAEALLASLAELTSADHPHTGAQDAERIEAPAAEESASGVQAAQSSPATPGEDRLVPTAPIVDEELAAGVPTERIDGLDELTAADADTDAPASADDAGTDPPTQASDEV